MTPPRSTPARRQNTGRWIVIAMLSMAALMSAAVAQDSPRPQPQPPSQPITASEPADPTPIAEPAAAPETPTVTPPATAVLPAAAPATGGATDDQSAPPANGTTPHNGSRRAPAAGTVKLGFEDVTINQFIPFIVESTGKIVIVPTTSATLLNGKKITLVNDEPIDRAQALDIIFRAFRINGIGVIEHEELIILYDFTADQDLIRTAPILGPDVDVLTRNDLGTLVIKFYRLKFRDPESIVEIWGKDKTSQYPMIWPDVSSSQLVLLGDVDMAQQMQRLINQLDVQPGNVVIRTFKLRHADAGAIQQNIQDIFEDSGAGGARGGGGSQNQAVRQAQRAAQAAARGQQPGVGGTGAGPSVDLKVTTITQQNSLTVSGDPGTVEQIADLIEHYWDLPLSPASVKVYDLKYVDPLKVRDKLRNMLGAGGGAAGSAPGGQQGRPPGQPGAQTTAAQIVNGIYQIEAYPDFNRLIVISKTKESLVFLDAFIAQIDVPLDPNKPEVINLKHAEAQDITEIINALFAETGSGTGIRLPAQGLTQTSSLETGAAGSSTAGGTGTGGGATTPSASTQQNRLDLPWVRGRSRADDQEKQTEPSPIIGKVRVVPIFRQNAVMVLAQPEYRDSIRQVIESLDKPGRQVMISAIVAEVELTDEFAFGLRFSSSDITSNVTDNSIGASLGFANTAENLFSEFFTSSTLNVNADINALLQALNQKTNVRVLQEPRVFTADNQEAFFFDGQQIPFISESQTTDQGGLNQTTTYKDVGVQLSARPRITVQKDVDMEINLVLSSVVPGQTLFGSAIINKRQTSSRLIVRNGQTIVLSGILKEEESKITRGLPFLSDIPLIGEIFKSRENATKRTELVAFITPIVVENPSENDDNFNKEERERLNTLGRPLDEQLKDPDAKDTIRRRIVPGSFPKPAEKSTDSSHKSPYDP